MTATTGEVRVEPNIEVYTVAVTTVPKEGLYALVQQRDQDPALGEWAVPGMTLAGDYIELPDAARQVVSDATGIEEVPHVDQIYVIDHTSNDVRGWGMSIIYYAALPADVLMPAVEQRPDTMMARAENVRAHVVDLVDDSNEIVELAFDHRRVVNDVIKSMQSELWYGPKADRRPLPTELLKILPEKFTLTEFQGVCETILGIKVNKDDFRRRVTKTYQMVEGTGEYALGPKGRPAQLFRAIEEVGAK